ncbi:hypothetical protein [Azospirillum sp.]|uniref:hypothetical protein n=1 Tax=Azospirillum sp. TaxID=34012 RepID=UPI002D256E2C|nr:hypothetical protein [Azospirillum sp.]HYD63989.1 hypothetical protein [Azospirillum sp.]
MHRTFRRTFLAAAALAALLAGGCSQTDHYSGTAGYPGSTGPGSTGMPSGSSAAAPLEGSRSGVERSGGGVSIEPGPTAPGGMQPGTLTGDGRGGALDEPGT